MGKLELYLLGALALVLLLGGAIFYGRHWQHELDDAKAEKAVAEANAKTEALQDRLDKSKEDHARELASVTTKHADDLVHAVADVKPVIVRIPTDSSQVSQAVTATGTASASVEGSTQLPVSVERNIGPALVMLAGECQRDRDALIGWQQWFASQSEVWAR